MMISQLLYGNEEFLVTINSNKVLVFNLLRQLDLRWWPPVHTLPLGAALQRVDLMVLLKAYRLQ